MPARAEAQAESQSALPVASPADPSTRWRPPQGLTAFLLAVWFGVSFVIPFFARDLAFDFFGWPFGFWIGAQGAPVAYGLICWFYAWRVNKLEAQATAANAGPQH